MKTPLGELLVESGIITVKTLERALTRQQGSGKRLGIVLDEMGVITQQELIEALAQQFGFETVQGIAGLDFPDQLLQLIPEELALRKLVFPLRREDGVLALAVTDPFDTDTIEFLERQNATTIVPVLATREDILDAVKLHYLGNQPAGNGAVKVLVLDGSPEVTSEMQGALSKEGYQVLTANDGVEGLRIAFSRNPDLIQECQDKGLIIIGCGLKRNIVRFLPALNVTPQEMDEALDIFAGSLAELSRK